MVNKVGSSHDLSCVFAYFNSIHLYLEHIIRFANLHVSVASVFVLTLAASQQ